MSKKQTELLSDNHERFVHWMKVIVKSKHQASSNNMSKAMESVPFFKFNKKLKVKC